MTTTQVHHFSILDRNYALTVFENRIGVARGYGGPFKYMTVEDANVYGYFPKLLKTKLKFNGNASGLEENLLLCVRLRSELTVVVTILEFILANGRTPR